MTAPELFRRAAHFIVHPPTSQQGVRRELHEVVGSVRSVGGGLHTSYSIVCVFTVTVGREDLIF